MEGALQDEVESLEAILMEDVCISRNPETGIPEMIETTVFPVVDGDTDRQYVCVTLQVIPIEGYPDVSPVFNLVKPRGLDDLRLNEIKAACTDKLVESLGFPVVFDLIEVVREHLTGSNLPSGQCVVCLYGFQDGDDFTKTECFHYLHSYCLARHITASRKNYHEEHDKLPAWLRKTASPFQASCPVCREAIADDAASLANALPPAELEMAPDFNLTDDLKQLQAQMLNLFLRQKSRGAIIDIEAESGSVISIETERERARRERAKAGGNDQDEQQFNGADETLGSPDKDDEEESYAQPQDYSKYQKAPRSNSNHSPVQTAQNSTNFAPVVTQSQRFAGDPTNNNYHHNRRHHRGGRRHANHHHHHRDREQYRDRHATDSNSSSSHSSQQPNAEHTSQPQAAGKHHKTQR